MGEMNLDLWQMLERCPGPRATNVLDILNYAVIDDDNHQTPSFFDAAIAMYYFYKIKGAIA
jgi:hypothetical protein